MGNSASWFSATAGIECATRFHPDDVLLVKEALKPAFREVMDWKGVRKCCRQELITAATVLCGRQALAQATASHFTLTEFAAAVLLASNMVYSLDEQEVVGVEILNMVRIL